MKAQVRVIKTQRGHADALARLSGLMDKDLKPGSADEAELELLALVIESYERRRVAPVTPDPIEAIMFRMDQKQLSMKDLVPYIGSISKVSEVLSRKRPLSLSMIRKLHTGLRIPAEVLIAGSEDRDVDLSAEPQYKKTYLDGAAMLDEGRPIVALTLRHDRLDNFWFALMHELIHVQKHLKPSHLFIADNLDDKTRSTNEEHEADQGAREALIPSAEREKSAVRITHASEDAIALANKLRIHPAIVAGRVRHETGNWRALPGLLGTKGEVAKNFEDQLGGHRLPTG